MSGMALDSVAVLYLTALFVLGLATLRKGHTALFWFGSFPVPMDRWRADAAHAAAAAAEARKDLQ